MADHFFAEIYESIKLKKQQGELDDIEKCVLKLVRTLLEDIGDKDEYFKISDVIPTGSFYEKTKIHCPDEFDYMIVIDPTPFARKLTIHSECKSSPWFSSMQGLPGLGEDRSSDLYFENRVKGPWGPEKTLWDRLNELISDGRDMQRRTSSGNVVVLKHIKHHKLYLEYRSRENVLEIGVDLMLAFVHPYDECISQNSGFPHSPKTEHQLRKLGCHLVSKSCHCAINKDSDKSYRRYRCKCWFISFAAMETEAMRNLDDNHKKCYQVMKALLVGNVSYPGKCMNLSSYMLKSAFLHHVFGERSCRKMVYASCISSILEYIQEGFQNVKMPCFFARDLNVWGRVVVAPAMMPIHDWLREIRGGKVSESMEEALRDAEKKNNYPIKTDWLELEYDPTLHAKLWVEFWRRIIILIKQKIGGASSGRLPWAKLTEEFSIIRNVIVKMLEQYSASKSGKGWVLDCVQAAVGPSNDKLDPFTEIPPAVKDIFPTYIDEWKKITESDLFDELKSVK